MTTGGRRDGGDHLGRGEGRDRHAHRLRRPRRQRRARRQHRAAGDATVTWITFATAPPPPVPGKSVVVKVVSGRCSSSSRGAATRRGRPAPAKGFVPFTGAANIPVGSQLDTSKGRVALTSAADTGGAKTQTSDFYEGSSRSSRACPKKKPKKAKALITDLVMKGQIARSQCAPLKGARAAAATPRRRRRARSRCSASCGATARASSARTASTARRRCAGRSGWCEDRCDGTLTKVRRGTVSVRDFKRKKTVKVKAGHSYLARAVTSKSRRKKK